MRVVMCDSCKQIVAPPKRVSTWRIELATKDPTSYDLCTECSNKVRSFIEKGGKNGSTS